MLPKFCAEPQKQALFSVSLPLFKNDFSKETFSTVSTAGVSGRWAGWDSPSKQRKLIAKKTPKSAPRTHLSTAPWNDGGRSFSTRARLAGYAKNTQELAGFRESEHFGQFMSAVLRTP
jgi:hypothetical protein